MRWYPAPDPKARPPVAVITEAGAGHLQLVTDQGEILGHAGGPTGRDRDRCFDILHGLPAATVVYALPKLKGVIQTTGADRWAGRMWRHTLSSVTLDAGPKVLPMHRPFDGVDRLDAASGCLTAVDWLWALGVPAGSLSSMASRLWRRTLSRELDLHYPDEGRLAFYGGRQETPLGPVAASQAVLWDLAAAYPTSMASEPYARRLIEVSPVTRHDRGGQGLVQAEVRIPAGPIGPLPLRLDERTVCYVTGTGDRSVVGWWPWREAAMATRAGCDLRVLRCFAPLGEIDLFGPWWALAAPGRRLPGPARRMAKAVTSSLWGTFAMSDRRARHVRWKDLEGRQVVVVRTTGTIRNPWAVAVAAETTARVRVRLHDQALTVVPSILHCDTDGIIAGEAVRPDGPGWAAKQRMETVEVRAPQVYRWKCSDCDLHAPWHYCVAGAPTAGAAASMFGRFGRRHAAPSMGGWSQVTLPPMPLERLVTVAPVAETVLSSPSVP